MSLSGKLTLAATMLLSFLAAATAHAQWLKSGGGDLVIRGGWLFDGVGETRRPNSGIVIRNGKIAEVDAEAQTQLPGNSEIINLQESRS